jgi:predicted O-methyltransferase YrrM
MDSLFLRLVRMPLLKALIERIVIPIGDVLLAPFVLAAALLLKMVRRVGVYRMRLGRAILRGVGVFPIRDHYYEPLFDPRHLRRPLSEDRALPGIDLNAAEQLTLLERHRFQDELHALPRARRSGFEYWYDNPNFGPGDAEILYGLIRLHRPATIIEIGSGMSTLMAANAVRANRAEDGAYACRQLCIEPYEMAWLEELPGVEVVRRRLEDLDDGLFRALGPGDMLFIDSSHVIRPQGDVLREFLEVLPVLKPGVLVHVHDIFTPRDYPEEWLVDQVRLWNEQYLVEAFLSHNRDFRIVAAVNWLSRHHRDRLAAKCPVFAEGLAPCPPASLWLQRA